MAGSVDETEGNAGVRPSGSKAALPVSFLLLVLLSLALFLSGCEIVFRVVLVVPQINACVTYDQSGNPCPPNSPQQGSQARPVYQRGR
jgi:hypothetical protein